MLHKLPNEFTDKKISPWGGIHLFKSVYDKLGLREFFGELPLPQPGSNRGFDPLDVVEAFLVSVVLGSQRLAHSGMLRSDEVIREIFNWKKGAPSASTLSRFFKKFSIELNDSIFPSIQKHLMDRVGLEKMTIDIDSTVITRHGKQEYARKGYNPNSRGKNSHHPLLAFCDDLKMVINSWMRSGDCHTSTQTNEFLDEVFEIIGPARIGLVRMDSGFYSEQIMKKLEGTEGGITYLIKAKMTSRLRSKIYQIENWHSPNMKEGAYEYSEIMYRGTSWEDPRRIVVCRKKKKKELEQKHKNKLLFKDLEEKESYDYYAIVTNSSLPCSAVHTLYNKRANCENIIKELKYDYSVEGFALHSFAAMEAAFRFIMMAYNIMIIFKQYAFKSKHVHKLSTIKFQCIAIGSYVIKRGRNKMLKLSGSGKRRHFLEKVFDNIEKIPPDFSIPIA